MRTVPYRRLILLALFWLPLSCELPVEQNPYEDRLVVFGNLVANVPVLDTVFVSLSYRIEEPHQEAVKWISDADVKLMTGDDSFPLYPVVGKPGRYLDTTFSHMIQPSMTYHLEVTWQGYEARATTTVPDTFSLQSIPSSQWSCNGEPQGVPAIDLHMDENTPEKIQQALVTGDYSRVALDTVVYKEGECWSASFASIPLFVLQWEADTQPGLVRIVSLALKDTVTNAIVDTSLSAAAFKGPMYRDEDGNYYRPNPFVWNTTRPEQPMNWIYFNYYGPHLITVVAMDQTIHDYFQGDPFRINQYVLPEGNIEGGYGLFSSSFVRPFLVYVARDTSDNGRH
ncbi:MAG: DUF4249 family protein [Fidelibacterota bacterium]